MQRVTARAGANIALIKYWGKRDAGSNVPATPSLSLTLDSLTTTTTVTRLGGSTSTLRDTFNINGESLSGKGAERLRRYLDLWRSEGLIDGQFAVSSRNSFPTGAGLASSASGFAAMAKALAQFSGKRIGDRRLSQLARRGSGSAARSIPGGIAAMPLSDDPAAKMLVEADQVPWGMVIAEVESTPKTVGSTEGMNLSRDTSPYYPTWLATARNDYKAMLAAVDALDFTAVGELAEANSHAMHACMIATRPALLYWNDVTLRVLHELARWRNDGTVEAYATIDAGPHVCLLAKREDLERVRKLVAKVEGVARTKINRPGPAATVLEAV